jgi:O-antigen ligase
MDPVVIVLMLYLSMHGYIPAVMTTDQAGAGADGTVGQVLQAVFLLVFGLLALPSCKRMLAGVRHAYPLLAIGALAVLSTAWSQDPAVTFRRSVMLMAPTLFALFLHVRGELRQMKLMLLTGIAAAALSIAACVFYPAFGVDRTFHNGAWQGIFSQKNGLARACVFFMLPAVVLLGRSAKKSLVGMLGLLTFGFLLIMTKSATGLVLAAVMIPATLAFRLVRRLPRNELMVVSVALVAAVTAAVFMVGSNFQSLLLLLGRDSSLTGRTEVWSGAVEAITKHPLLGYGYSAFWMGLKGESANVVLAARWLVPAAHNGFLDLWLQLGGAGLVLFLLTLGWGCSSALWCLRNIGGPAVEWSAAVMLFTIAYNFDESFLAAPRELLWVAYGLAFLNLQVWKVEKNAALSETGLNAVLEQSGVKTGGYAGSMSGVI